MNRLHLLFLSVALLLFVGCKSIGPGTIPRDRFDYSGALSRSWKNQMLLNLVKTRYLDLPLFLDVGQIVSGYTLETAATVGGSLAETDAFGGSTATLGGSARYTDRPTITYTPLTGNKFLEGFLAPIEPAKIFSLVQNGYAADFILEMSVDALNGLRNRPVILGARRSADPDFFRVLELLRDIQDAGAVGLRVERPTNGLPTTVIFFRSDRAEPAIETKITEVQELLGVTAGQSSYRLVQSPLRGGPGELAVHTRSVSQLMSALALGVEIPSTHLERKLTPPVADIPAGETPLLRVHSGRKQPADVFVAVPYEGEWFWVANDDWRSKRTFSSILFLFTLADAGSPENLPTITIPAQ